MPSISIRAPTSSTIQVHFVLQQLDYLAFIDIYHERIKAFHVKDAEFRPSGKAGVYGSYSGWTERPGRFRSLGDGQIDFGSIFTRSLRIMAMTAGRCSNGNAPKSTRSRERPKALRSLPAT